LLSPCQAGYLFAHRSRYSGNKKPTEVGKSEDI